MEPFDQSFKAAAGYEPFRWQERLYRRLLNKIPDVVYIPTGLGKTSIIPIWLLALAESHRHEGALPIIPRRLVYIVNRRTVVDQATDVVQRMRERLWRPWNTDWCEHGTTLRSLVTQLRRLARTDTDDVPLAVSTLRGELADNQEWKADPARPAIIIGTVDMIGSKLLFSGYGDTFRLRPHHAGLIGHDTLIVLDEAHLTPAFGKLLRQVADAQKSANETRPIRVLELSATPSSADDLDVFRLEPEDEEDKIVQERLNAVKSLRLQDVQPEDLHEILAESALAHEEKASKVLIYVRSPEHAQKVKDELQKKLKNEGKDRVALLTGTIRGYERDRLVRENTVYQDFLNHESSVEQTAYLVSTSAGEVGIDLDADHMVCDLTTLDSMIQRLGRVNRCPDRREDTSVNRRGQRYAQIDVLIPGEDQKRKKKVPDLDGAIKQTRPVLEQLPKREDDGYDASPKTLQNLLQTISDEEKQQAFAPRPPIVPIRDILLDAWSLTSIRESMPGRPEVAAYLHGLTSDLADLPETFVVWRREVDLLANAKPKLDSETLQEWFQACRIEARERLRERTDRVFRHLKEIDKRHEGKTIQVVLLSGRADVELLKLSELIKGRENRIAHRTVVLPVEAGGLTEEGTLDGSVKERAVDVAESDTTRMRLILKCRDDFYTVQRLDSIESHEDETEDRAQTEKPCKSPRDAAAQIAREESIARKNKMVVSLLVPLQEPPDGAEDEAERVFLLLLKQRKEEARDNPETAPSEKQPTLDEHTKQVVTQATRIGEALGLPKDLKQALVIAAKWHDRGKARRIWQRAIYNTNAEPLAKPGLRGMKPLRGYRHEFGSLLDAAKSDEVMQHPERDLILHLIAAHHGRARPHFESDAFGQERTTRENEETAHEVMRRFARLQQRFGHWGLAWLESLLWCADVAASRESAQFTSSEVNE